MTLTYPGKSGPVRMLHWTATKEVASYGGDIMKPRTIALFVGTGLIFGKLPYMRPISQTRAEMSSADAQMQRHMYSRIEYAY